MSKEAHQKRQEAEAALRALSDRMNGEFTPQDVVDAARPATSPMHYLFEWDDSIAAHEYRRHQARGFIRSVRIVYKEQVYRKEVPAYVHTEPEDRTQQGYKAIGIVKGDDEKMNELLAAEFKRVLGALERAQNIAEFFGREDDVAKLVQQVRLVFAETRQWSGQLDS